MSARPTDAARILVLGLDMGDGRLIRDWCRCGHLPNLARMIDAGTWLELAKHKLLENVHIFWYIFIHLDVSCGMSNTWMAEPVG